MHDFEKEYICRVNTECIDCKYKIDCRKNIILLKCNKFVEYDGKGKKIEPLERS